MKILPLTRLFIVATTCLVSSLTYADWTRPLEKAGFRGKIVTGFEAGVPTAVEVFIARDIAFRPRPILGWSNYTPEFSSALLTLMSHVKFTVAFTEATNDPRTAEGAIVTAIDRKNLEKPILLITPRMNMQMLRSALLFLTQRAARRRPLPQTTACDFDLRRAN